MRCVAKLDEAYIERMEDVLKVYEQPLNALAPVICLDEKPVVLHADTRRRRRSLRATPLAATTSTNGAERRMFSAPWNPGRDATSPKLRRLAHPPTSPSSCSTSQPSIPPPRPSTWRSTTSRPIPARWPRTGLAKKRAAGCGTGSRSTTRRNMEAGLIGRRSKSDSSPDSVSASDGSQASKNSSNKNPRLSKAGRR
jgi:hypothetical protein